MRKLALSLLEDSLLFVVHKLEQIKYTRAHRADLLMVMTRIAASHVDSMLFLAGTTNSDPTVMALMRPATEACLQALWLYYVAPESLIENIFDTEKVFPGKWEDLLTALRPHAPTKLLDQASRTWNSFCGYTHSGVHQIALNFGSGGKLVERYDDELIVSALWLTVQTFAAYAMVICKVFGYEDQESEIGVYRNLWVAPDEFEAKLKDYKPQ
jgi:hypothetical protein